MANAESRSRFKLLRPFRLRTLLVLLSLAALLCGWQADRFHRRRQAIALLNRWELWVEEQEPAYDGLPWNLLPDRVCLWLLPWSSTCSSVSYLPFICEIPSQNSPPGIVADDVGATTSWNRQPTAAECKELVAAIAALTELTYILVPFELDDDDLRSLSHLSNLESFGFKTRGLTSVGVSSIQKLQKINGLTITFDSPACVSVEVVAKLNQLPCLEMLSTGPLPHGTVARIKAVLPHVNVVIEDMPEQKAP